MRPGSGYWVRIVVAALIASTLAACATSPPRRGETQAILDIRADYLRTHPEGPFNLEIARSEVALGMGYYDVLAAWGMPDARLSDNERGEERWTYVIKSDNEVDGVRYDFLFVKQVVVEWESSLDVASGFSPAHSDGRGVSMRVPPTPATTLGEGARKGGVRSTMR